MQEVPIAIVTVRPGIPFWLAFTAFATNMGALIVVDQIDVTALGLQVSNWVTAVVISVIVGGAVYGKAKVDEVRGPTATQVDAE